jgi:hypothetical protein
MENIDLVPLLVTDVDIMGLRIGAGNMNPFNYATLEGGWAERVGTAAEDSLKRAANPASVSRLFEKRTWSFNLLYPSKSPSD